MSRQRIFISYAEQDGSGLAKRLQNDLRQSGYSPLVPEAEIAGQSKSQSSASAILGCSIQIALLSPESQVSVRCRAEQLYALRKGKRIIALQTGKRLMPPPYFQEIAILSDKKGYGTVLKEIVQKIDEAKRVELPSALQRTRVFTPSFPEHYIKTPQSIIKLQKLILRDEFNERGRNTILLGPAGAGKTVLAQAVCQDELIQAAFPDGIFWIRVGTDPLDLLDQLQHIGHFFEDKPLSNAASIRIAMEQLRRLMTDKAVLFVLDDVTQIEQAILLRVNTPLTRTLLTTRNPHIVEALPSEVYDHKTFSFSHSLELLERITGTSDDAFEGIISRTGQLPLALNIAGSSLKQGKKPIEWIGEFDVYAQELLGDTPEDEEEILHVCMEVFFLESGSPIRIGMYALTALTPGTAIPRSIILKLLDALPKPLPPGVTEQLLGILHTLGLIFPLDEKAAYVIRDTLHGYSKPHVTNESGLHRRFLKRINPGSKPWYTIEKFKNYIAHRLGHHLMMAEQLESLRNLLTDFKWLAFKLDQAGVNELLKEFKYLPEDNTLRILEEALELSSKTLHFDPLQLSSQLLSRLQGLDVTVIQELLQQALLVKQKNEILLIPHKRSLATPGSALLKTLSGHQDVVRTLAISSDGQFVFSASEDRTIRKWDISSGNLYRTFSGHAAGVNVIAISHDDSRVITGSDDATIMVWDSESGALLHAFLDHVGRILSICMMPDGKHVLSASEQGGLLLWRLSDGALIKRFPQTDTGIWSICVLPDGLSAITASASNHIQVWNLETGLIEHTLSAHSDWVWDICLTPDGRHLISASEDQTILVWDLSTFKVTQLLRGHLGGVRAVAVSPGGRYAVSASEDRSLKVWSLESGTIVRTFTGHDRWVWDVDITPNGLCAISASDDHSLKIWSIASQNYRPRIDAHKKSIRAVKITPENHHALSVSDDRTLGVWNMATGKLQHTLEGHSDWVWDLAFTKDTMYAITASFDHTLRVWNLQTGSTKYVLSGHTDWVWQVIPTGDSRQAISGSEDGTIRIWDIRQGKLVQKLSGHEGGVHCLALSHDSNYIFSGSADKTVRMWDRRSNALINTLVGADAPVRSIKIATISNLVIASTETGNILVWDLFRGKLLHNFTGHEGPVTELLLLPLELKLITSGEDGLIKIWDLVDGRLQNTINAHTATVRALSLAPSGDLLISVSDDRKLLLWNVESLEQCGSFYSDRALTCCDIDRDGRHVIAGDAGGGIHILRMEF